MGVALSVATACGGNSEEAGRETREGTGGSNGSGGLGATGGSGGSDVTVGAGGGGPSTGGALSGEIDCSGTFGPAEVLLEDTLPFSPALSEDGLVLYYANGENGNEDFKFSVRANQDQTFPVGTPLPELDALCDVYDDRTIDASLDGLRVYFSCYPPAEVGHTDHPLFMAERPDLESDFDTPVQVASFPSSASVSADELSVYGAAFGASTTLVSTRASLDDSFGPPMPLLGLDGRGFFAPVMAPGELEIYAASSGFIYYASRTDPTADFGETQPLDIIPAGYTSGGSPEISSDCRQLLFIAFLPEGGGHILTATR